MWGLLSQNLSQKKYIQFPNLTYNWTATVVVVLLMFSRLINNFLKTKFGIQEKQLIGEGIQYLPWYHLSMIIMVLVQVNWNMFDLGIWALIYVGTSILRKGLNSIRAKKQSMQNGYSYDPKLTSLVENLKLFSALLALIGATLFFMVHVTFEGVSIKILSLLIFPLMILTCESAFSWLQCSLYKQHLLEKFNVNIPTIIPSPKITLIQKICNNSIKVWHFYYIIRIFMKEFFQSISSLIQYIWIFPILKAFFVSIMLLYTSISKYKSYNAVVSRFNKIVTSQSTHTDQNCMICMSQLLNCCKINICGHLFHYRCLFTWMRTKAECPICRASLTQ